MNETEIAEFGTAMQTTALRMIGMIPVRPASAAPPMPEMVEVSDGVWLSREIVDFLSRTPPRVVLGALEGQ